MGEEVKKVNTNNTMNIAQLFPNYAYYELGWLFDPWELMDYILYMQVEEEAKVEERNKEEAPVAVPEAEKKDEAAAAEGEEKKKEEAAAKEPPLPPPPCIFGINLHCTGCANKIRRCILRCKGN